MDLRRERLEYPELKAMVRHQLTPWRADKVLIEDSGNGHALWRQLKSEGTAEDLKDISVKSVCRQRSLLAACR